LVLQVRLNGLVVEVLPRPDIAEGIFFEYLRYDDPISPEFRDRVVDGFPFLLAPLAQVKGVNFGQSPQTQANTSVNPVFRAVGAFVDAASAQASGLIGMFQRGVSDAATHAGNSAKSFSDAVVHVGKDLDRHRNSLVQAVAKVPQNVVALPQTVAFLPQTMAKWCKSLASAWAERGDKDPIQVVSEWVASNMTPENLEKEQEPVAFVQRRESLGRAFGYPLSRWFSDVYTAPDEIGLKILPTMSTARRVFLAFVHVYLLLLLIVSFPGSYTTRTKFVIRKTKTSSSNAASSHQESYSVVSDSETEASWFEPSVKEADPSSMEKNPRLLTRCRSIPCLSRNGAVKFPPRRGILSKARRSFRSSNADEFEESTAGSTCGQLKKKSMSYYL